MAVSSKTGACILAVLLGLCIAARTAVAQGKILDQLQVDGGNTSVSADGQVLSLYLYNTTGASGFRSKKLYQYVRTDLEIKLIPDNSAGTVTTFFLVSEGPWETHDEIDLEFLGNSTGEPYTLHTNIFANGKGQKEQQFKLWFDPSKDFHIYSIVWTKKNILVLVDGSPIREFRNLDRKDQLPYPSQEMRLHGSLWNADDWATQGGRVKTNWTMQPFVAQYRNFAAITSLPARFNYNEQELKRNEKYMIYNYCTDTKRFINGTAPPECPKR